MPDSFCTPNHTRAPNLALWTLLTHLEMTYALQLFSATTRKLVSLSAAQHHVNIHGRPHTNMLSSRISLAHLLLVAAALPLPVFRVQSISYPQPELSVIERVLSLPSRSAVVADLCLCAGLSHGGVAPLPAVASFIMRWSRVPPCPRPDPSSAFVISSIFDTSPVYVRW